MAGQTGSFRRAAGYGVVRPHQCERMYLLDTNVVSELRKQRPHGAVLAWLQSVNERELHISAVTLGEIQAGIEITREQDPARAAEIEVWADELPAFWNVLSMDP